MIFEMAGAREHMTKELTSKLFGLAEDAHREKNLDEFWIIVSHKPDMILDNVIREGIVITNKKPPKMINSLCFHAIWSKGLFEPEWILPMELNFEVPMTDTRSELVENSVKGMML